MAGAGAETGLQNFNKQTDQRKLDQRALDQFNMAMAQNKQGQKVTDIGRSDRNQDILVENAGRVYDAGWRNYQAAMQWKQISLEAGRGNAALALQRLNLLEQMGMNDQQMALRIQGVKQALQQGNFENALKLAELGIKQDTLEASRYLGALNAAVRDQRGVLGGMPAAGQISAVLPMITSGKVVPPPWVDIVGIRQQAERDLKMGPGGPKIQGQNIDDRVRQMIGQALMADPQRTLQWLQSVGRMPLAGATQQYDYGLTNE
jgi:hypothetical protein